MKRCWYILALIMRTVKNPSPRISRVANVISSVFFIGTTLVVSGPSALLLGCSHAWEDYDPRIGTGGSGSGSSGAGAGGSGNAKCGGTSVLVSDFGQNDLDSFWEVNNWGGATMGESGGELVVTLPMNSPDGAAAYVISRYYYDFRNDFISVEVPQMPDLMGATWTALSVGPNEDNYVEIFREGTMLNFAMELAGNYNKYLSIPYDPTQHRHWQMREKDGRVYYETSPDGADWTAQTDIPIPKTLSLEYSRMVMASGAEANQANPGKAHFDRFNGGGVPKQKYCLINSIQDDFNDGSKSDQWLRSHEDQPAMTLEENGQFVVRYVPNMQAHAELSSSRAYDLRGSSIVLEVPVVPDGAAPAYAGIELNGPGNKDVEMFVSGGELKLAIDVEGNLQELSAIPYSAQEHRWWRIRENADTLYWETSPDAKAWVTRLEMSPPPVPVSLLGVELIGGTWAEAPNPGEARMDNLNVSMP